jgi:hypothetical protein
VLVRRKLRLATVWLIIFRPIHLYWTSVDGAGCSDEGTRLMVGTIINIVTDILVVLMPIPIINKLALPRRDKIVLGFLMGLGAL